MSNTETRYSPRESLYIRLMERESGAENARFVAAMMASWYHDSGVLPACMGLTPESFAAMTEHYFPGFDLPESPTKQENWQLQMPELDELEALFADFAVDDNIERRWIATMLIAGCNGHHHLWEDLGLFCRPDLTAMIAENFPELAIRNDRDMKWKKFIYKQLCDREGIIACPAPTCDACADFKVCFASEEEPTV